MQIYIHYFLHLIAPLFIAIIFFKKNWKKAYLIFIATMLVDLDHLFANPIFDSNRCSINFHPLHTFYAFGLYILLLFLARPLNIIGIGLVLHMITDLIDCLFMFSNCKECLINSSTIEILNFISRIGKIL